MGTRTPRRRRTTRPPAQPPVRPIIYDVTLTLVDTTPPIWRRVQVASTTTLADLHPIFQTVMGWQDYHLHLFHIAGDDYGEPDEEYGAPIINEARVRLDQLVTGHALDFEYLYDFGDHWVHRIALRNLQEQSPLGRYPVCVDGERACPPEDVGGVDGFVRFLAAIADPEDEEHEQYLTWVGGSYDPQALDLVAINRALDRWSAASTPARQRPAPVTPPPPLPPPPAG